MKIKSRAARIDEKLLDDLFNASITRIDKSLSRGKRKDMTMPKMTNLLTRCPSYANLLKELKSLPEKNE